MRELMHDNINPFIGACFDTPSPCMLFLYCPKGSLHVSHETGLKISPWCILLYFSWTATKVHSRVRVLGAASTKQHGPCFLPPPPEITCGIGWA